MQSSTPRFIDCHMHLCHPGWDGPPATIINRLAQQGIDVLVQGGTDPRNWQEQEALHGQSPLRIVTCFGLHPEFIPAGPEERATVLQELGRALARADLVGEIGLDRRPAVLAKTSFEVQRAAFELQWRMAQEAEKSAVLHVVRAHEDVLGIILRCPATRPFMIHGFTSSLAIARRYVEAGGYISLGSHVLRPSGARLQEVVTGIPRDRLLVESDSPQPGQKDHATLAHIYGQIARWLVMDEGEFAESVAANFWNFSGLHS